MTGVDPLLVAGGVWLWDSYGKDAFSWLVKRLGKRAEELKGAGWEKVDWVLAARTYRQEMARQYGWMHIFGMSQPVPLSNIFTDVYLLDKPSAWQRHTIQELQRQSHAQADEDREHRHNGVELVLQQTRLFILGQPGAGKTTFLKYLATQAVQGQLDAIPIFVEMKAWSAGRSDLLSFLVHQFAICNFPDAQPFVEHILENGKAIILFDGLDEVNLEGGDRDHIISVVRDFARQYSKNKMVITCRTAATDYLFERFSYCELTDFTKEQMHAFVGRWFQNDKVKRQAFWKAFTQPDNQRLDDLGRRPLLLTMLCLTFEETMAFPYRRTELYEEAIDALLKKWDSSRSIQRDVIYRKLSPGYKRQLLMEIAAETYERDEIFMRKSDLVEQIVRFIRRLPPIDTTEDIDGEAVLNAIEAQHGLIIERANNIYSFSHLTFHEYFTARYVADHPEPAVLRGAIAHAADMRWREVLLLTASMLDYRNIAHLFDIWCKQLQQYVQADTDLMVFIQWAVRKNSAKGELQSSSARATVIMMALIDFGFIRALTLARALSRALARVSVLALTLTSANDLASDLVRDLVRDLALTLTRNFDLSTASIRIPTLASFGDRALRLTRQLALALTTASVDDRVRNLTRSIIQDLDLTLGLINTSARISDHILVHPMDIPQIDDILVTKSELSQITLWYSVLQCAECLALGKPTSEEEVKQFRYEYLENALSQLEKWHRDAVVVQEIRSILPEPSTKDPEAWNTFVAKLRDILIQYHDIGHRWQFGEVQLDALNTYFTSTERLIECLDVAVVENRESVLNRLLLPPDLSISVNS